MTTGGGTLDVEVEAGDKNGTGGVRISILTERSLESNTPGKSDRATHKPSPREML